MTIGIICLTIVVIVYILCKFGIITPCKHHWQRVDQEFMWNASMPDSRRNPGNCIHRYEIMQCSKCGTVKTIKII